MKEQEIRTCQHHGETIFAARSDGRGGIRWRCLKCETEAVQKRRDKLKIMAIAYKGGKCQCCGYDNYSGALEFHHINQDEKDFAISAKGYTRSWEKNKEELNKCVLVCATEKFTEVLFLALRNLSTTKLLHKRQLKDLKRIKYYDSTTYWKV